MNALRLLGLITLCSLSACAETPDVQMDFDQHGETFVKCDRGNRPEVCTQMYKPVCGKLSGGGTKWKSYGNACTACADKQVEGYIEGACD